MKSIIILFVLPLIFAENPAVKEFTNANNLFAQNVYKQLSQNQDGNFLVSPFSAETVLAFAQSGCKGESAEEIRNALHLPNKDKVESALKYLLPKFQSTELYTLHTANKLYIKNNFVINDEFKNAASVVYQTHPESVDFTKSVEAAKTINDWVGDHTNNKIRNLINSGDLDDDTRAVLVNALYFQANWSRPFQLVNTHKRRFFKTASDIIKVDTLTHYHQYFNYYECPHLQAQFLELPFKGDASLVVVLSNEKDGLSSLEKQLDQVFASQHELQKTFLNVLLPKFKIETIVDFKVVLQNLEVRQVFDAQMADLSGIAGDKGDLVIDKVAQKTYVDVSEEGVEAAAATISLTVEPYSGYLSPVIPTDFVVDHPFIFFVKVNGVIIFVGRVTDPSQY